MVLLTIERSRWGLEDAGKIESIFIDSAFCFMLVSLFKKNPTHYVILRVHKIRYIRYMISI